MSWLLPLSVGLTLLRVVLGAGAPIFVGFLLLNLVGVWAFFGSAGLGMFAASMTDSLSSLSLTTIPLFVLMGEILFRSDAVDVVFDSVDGLVGRMRGRLFAVTMALSTVFAALFGSAVAVVAMLGRTVLPAMHARGYDSRLSAAMIQGGASLAPIIPPSLLAVLIGSMANVSIASLLIAGLLPGLLIASLCLGYAYLRVAINPALERGEDDQTSTAVDMQALAQQLVHSPVRSEILPDAGHFICAERAAPALHRLLGDFLARHSSPPQGGAGRR
jgi:TRAP-type mannitol/chloroaromatic compound transport system permease large subunit